MLLYICKLLLYQINFPSMSLQIAVVMDRWFLSSKHVFISTRWKAFCYLNHNVMFILKWHKIMITIRLSIAAVAVRRAHWWNRRYSLSKLPRKGPPLSDRETRRFHSVRKLKHRRESADSTRSCQNPPIRRALVYPGKKTQREAAVSANSHRIRPRNFFLKIVQKGKKIQQK